MSQYHGTDPLRGLEWTGTELRPVRKTFAQAMRLAFAQAFLAGGPPNRTKHVKYDYEISGPAQDRLLAEWYLP